LGDGEAAIGISVDWQVIAMLLGGTDRDNDYRISLDSFFKFGSP